MNGFNGPDASLVIDDKMNSFVVASAAAGESVIQVKLNDYYFISEVALYNSPDELFSNIVVQIIDFSGNPNSGTDLLHIFSLLND